MNINDLKRHTLKQEDFFEEILELCPIAMIMMNSTGNIVYINKEVENIFGHTKQELINKNIEILVPTNIQSEHATLLQNYLKRQELKKIMDRDLVGITKSGQLVPIEIGLSPVHINNDTFIIASVVNISERKKVEDDSYKLAAIVSSTSDAIIAKSLDGIIQFWNQGAEKIFGHTSKEVIGKNISIIVPKNKQKELNDILDKIKLGQDLESLITQRIHKDGHLIHVSSTISAIKNKHDQTIGASIVARDISEQKKREEMFRTSIEASPSGTIMVDKDGTILLANQKMVELFGYDLEELVGQSVDTLVPKKYRNEHSKNRSEFLKNPIPRGMGTGRDLYGLRKDGIEIPIEIGLTPVKTSEGVFVISSIVDITERKAFEEKLKLKNSEMEQFVFTVSHDLKSPVVTLKGLTALLSEDIEDKNWVEVSKSIEGINRATNQMSKLIEDLLELSRIGTIPMSPNHISLDSVIEEVYDLNKSKFEKANVKFIFKKTKTEIFVDRSRLFQVIDNIIGNALKYGLNIDNKKNYIKIGHKIINDECQIYIKDNGPGINKKYHEKIFDLFERLDNDIEGTGVGLSIVKKTVELSKGRVWVISELGEGATFWIGLPLKNKKGNITNEK